VSDAELNSLREWLGHWGEGPNWSDPKGQSVPIAKVTLTALLDHVDYLRTAISGIRERALDGRLETMDRATIAALADDVLK